MLGLRFAYVPLGSGLGGTAATLAKLPEAPALYAFFRRSSLSPSSDSTAFNRDLLELLTADLAPTHVARFGPMHTGSLAARPLPPATLEDRLEEFCSDATNRELTASLLELATPLQAPLYVGKASNLRRRISTHVEPMSELGVRVRAAGLALERTILAYVLLDELIADKDIRLLEEIITYFCRPGFVLRPG